MNVYLFRVVFGFGILLLVAANFRGRGNYSDLKSLRESKNVLEQVVIGLQQEVDQLNVEVRLAHSSPAYALRLLKDRYHYTEPNEQILFFGD